MAIPDDIPARLNSLGRPAPTPAAVLHHLLDGRATFRALQEAVQNLSQRAPDDHDVLVVVRDIVALEIFFREPHTLLFRGTDQDGHPAWLVQHFTQLTAKVVYRPHHESGPRIITGFADR